MPRVTEKTSATERVALNVSDLEETEGGFRVTIRRSKTDQEGPGAKIGIMRAARQPARWAR
jgi:hypothetical protein